MPEIAESSRPTGLSDPYTRDPLISKVVHPIVALSLFAHLSLSEPTLSAVLGEPRFVITESSGGGSQLAELAELADPISLIDDHRFIRLADAIGHEPLVDGVRHPAEAIFATEYEMESAGIGEWIEQLLAAGRPSIAADAIRLAGRAEAVSLQDKLWLTQIGLASKSFDVRDAAMQAIEGWRDKGLLGLLREHSESDEFLSDYSSRIIRDIEG